MAEKAGAARPLGTRREVAEQLACFNTGPDGAASANAGTEFLYGPGMTIEIPTSSETVNQAIASISDDEIALPVLMCMCKKLAWKLMDIESGRVFGG